MAEAVLYNIASSLLNQLGSAAMKEFSLLWNSKDDLEKLQNTIKTIRDVLQDAERRQDTDEAVRGWLARLKNEIYRADDLFDEYTATALRKRVNNKYKEVRVFFSKSNQFAFQARTAHEVKDLRQRLDDIAKDINQFKLLVEGIGCQLEFNVQIREQSHAFAREDDIIGREKEKKEMIQRLFDEFSNLNQRVPVVTIVGIGGLGKTALAQLVYNDKQVEGHFPVRLWACVNYFSNLNVTLEKIVASGSSEKHCNLELDQLASMLMNKIRGKRFLLVLDDVWDDGRENWLKLQKLLDFGAKGSKVLVTTRNEIVATSIGMDKTKLRLGGLSDDDAWSLFVKMAFDPSESKVDHDLEMLGRQIVKKCGNVPLAIRSVGSFLYHKDKKQWSLILTNELAKVIPEDQNLIKKVLMISYNDLPPSLKHCFAYSSLFPKDHIFSKNLLMRLWMAQGYLDHQALENQSFEDVGEKFISRLVHGCFFQDVTKDEFGEVETFKMHDLMHDLATDITGNESLLINKFDLDEVKGRTLRHVAFDCEVIFSKEIKLQQKYLRTLLFHHRRVLSHTMLDRLIQKLRKLRTLDLSFLQMKRIPNSIGDLVHLRYLDLSENQALIELPSSISKLQLLQTMNLSNCSQLMYLPDDLQKLICLRHLLVQGCNNLTCMPSGLGEMTSLVTLDTFVVKNNIGELGYLAQLNNINGVLQIQLPRDGWQNCMVDANKLVVLKRKTKLQKLHIRWSWDDYIPKEQQDMANGVLDLLQPSTNLAYLELTNFCGSRVPSWVSLLDNLTSISISFSIKCLLLPSFSKLPRLKILFLYVLPLVEYMEDNLSCYDSRLFFPALEKLHIDCMQNLKGWWREMVPIHCGSNPMTAQSIITTNPMGSSISAPSFPRLSDLYLSDCPKLECFPLFPSAELVVFNKVNQVLLLHSSTILMMDMVDHSSATTTYSSPNYSSLSTLNQTRSFQLKDIGLWSINDLVSLPEWVMHASNLCSLSIHGCENLESLSPHLLQNLTALESLRVIECPKLDLLNAKESAGMIWTMLPRLKFVTLDLCGSAQSANLMRGLCELTALEELEISGYQPQNNDNFGTSWIAPPKLKVLTILNMDNVWNYTEVFQQFGKIEHLGIYISPLDGPELDAIPWEALGSVRILTFFSNYGTKSLPTRCHEYLPLLQHLKLEYCSELESLPSWVNRLQSLEIKESPLLMMKYKKPRGECWHEIQHIPYVHIE